MTSIIIRLSFFSWNMILIIWTVCFVFHMIMNGLKEAIKECKEMSMFWIFDDDEL